MSWYHSHAFDITNNKIDNLLLLIMQLQLHNMNINNPQLRTLKAASNLTIPTMTSILVSLIID